jgi:hypothetical protein
MHMTEELALPFLIKDLADRCDRRVAYKLYAIPRQSPVKDVQETPLALPGLALRNIQEETSSHISPSSFILVRIGKMSATFVSPYTSSWRTPRFRIVMCFLSAFMAPMASRPFRLRPTISRAVPTRAAISC